jgi:hypothetical protein
MTGRGVAEVPLCNEQLKRAVSSTYTQWALGRSMALAVPKLLAALL